MAYCGRARGNATLAAQIAGVTGTYATQAAVGCRFMGDLRVRAAVEAWMEAFAMSAALLTASITDMAEANLGPFVEWQEDKSLLIKVPTAEEWEAHKHWVKEIEVDPKSGKVTRLTLHDSLAAKRDLAKILKLYSDAPINVGTLNVTLQRMSDEELLAELERVRGGGEEERLPSTATRLIGPPIQVVEAPPSVPPQAEENTRNADTPGGKRKLPG